MHLAGRMIAAIAERSPEWRIEPEEVRAFLAATLLHDLGHYPNAHSLKDLAVARHETLTAELVQEGEVARTLRERVGTSPDLVAAIVDVRLSHQAPGLPFLRALLAGVLDPDRLDYLSRDAFFCGVPYGIQDVDFVIGEMRRTAGGHVAITEKGTLAVESLLFSRYLMYRAVYWHRTVRIATAMIKRAVLLGMQDGQIRPRDLYGLTDPGFLALLDARRHPAFALVDAVHARRLHRQSFRVRFDPGVKTIGVWNCRWIDWRWRPGCARPWQRNWASRSTTTRCSSTFRSATASPPNCWCSRTMVRSRSRFRRRTRCSGRTWWPGSGRRSARSRSSARDGRVWTLRCVASGRP